MPATTESKSDLVSKVPFVAKNLKEAEVISRCRRPKLGGKVTQVELNPDGKYVVTGDGIKRREFSKFAPALAYARTGKEDQA
jgi:hypothetical protein